jgi:hypothetical protein
MLALAYRWKRHINKKMKKIKCAAGENFDNLYMDTSDRIDVF